MARIAVKLGAAVGKRWGHTPVANQALDVATVMDLFDRIVSAMGGTADIEGLWPTDRAVLIAGLAEQIGLFQGLHGLPVIDSVIDPFGKTLMLLNQLAIDPPVTAYLGGFVGGDAMEQDFVTSRIRFAEPASLPGTAPMEPFPFEATFSRRIVMVEGSSIKWFGVGLPIGIGQRVATAQPHIFFTPRPGLGGYYDGTYDNLAGWSQLWDDYTTYNCRALHAAGVNQVLVLPLYKNSQLLDLGIFLDNWKEVVSRVVTCAINDINPYYLPGPFTFESIVTSSFSSGVAPHNNFHHKGAGVAAMTSVCFDLDGQAQTGGSSFHPGGGVFYRNVPPQGANPAGRDFYVGGRWTKFDTPDNNVSGYSHHACTERLLFHGLKTFSR